MSRSGAILYHLSDALSASGIALNAVLGIGGDAVVGTDFAELVPRVMDYPHTHAVVIAGEIGGCKEELLAARMKQDPARFAKPVIALLSGRCAPAGKTMGHAGAIITPGSEYGTFAAKKAALESAGVVVVNSQTALVKAVQKALGGRRYFDLARYRTHMRGLWEEAPKAATWTTLLTRAAPNVLELRGHRLADLIGKKSFVETVALMMDGILPSKRRLAELEAIGCRAALLAPPQSGAPESAHVSQRLAALLLSDMPPGPELEDDGSRAMHYVGRVAACLALIFGHRLRPGGSFGELCCMSLGGAAGGRPGTQEMLEAMIVASIDHGVTPPSAQATILAASVRASLEAAVCNGICAITHVHGGAGMDAAYFFRECLERARREQSTARAAAEQVVTQRMAAGRRIEGLGHRVHTDDPRRVPLLELARKLHCGGAAVSLASELEEIVAGVRGIRLPLNVDGVIGAIIADLNLPPMLASASFVLGRSAGLAAHYFEETGTQQPMRQIDFRQAVYRGPEPAKQPGPRKRG